ncbi:MAG: GNAT family N-acetyltransferase [bacterium]|nr:GNAT family N-acetyltransferase [bacterium]MCP5067640.1 GNAT family N-acetyltransferase [bacterium]
MERSEELALADLNLAESIREIARWHRDYRIEEREDLLFVAGFGSFPIGYGNSVIALGPNTVEDPERALALADEFFAALGRGYTLWIRGHLDKDLEEHAKKIGMPSLSDMPGMWLDAPTPERPLAEGLVVAQAKDVEALSRLAAIEAGSYATTGLPPEACEAVFAMPERLLNPYTVVAIGHADGQPAAAAIASLSNGVAGVYWVATLPEARGRGLGESCTRLVGNRALELGARGVVLQASSHGEPIYRRMGYREIGRYRWLAKGPPDGPKPSP